MSILSINVYQFNNKFQELIDLVTEIQPDILLTMESNKAWEEALYQLDHQYQHIEKIALENTYGMHFYTKLKVKDLAVHYFVAEDVPSVEVHLQTTGNKDFVFFGVHPPPPSPTEESTAIKKDGELLIIGKRIRKLELPVVVVGDFNSVAWSRITTLFSKTSGLLDSRKGKGFLSTFPANYPLLRCPIDLLFHSDTILVKELKTLSNIGSDHLPLYSEIVLTTRELTDNDRLATSTWVEVNDKIQEAKKS